MTQRKQIYKCPVCGNIVEVLTAGGGQLVCCGKPMELLEEKMKDQGAEKHVPVLEKIESGWLVKVGSVPHPMGEGHYIEWVEIWTGEDVARKFLVPGQKPETVFETETKPDLVRIYCNIHGLWRS